MSRFAPHRRHPDEGIPPDAARPHHLRHDHRRAADAACAVRLRHQHQSQVAAHRVSIADPGVSPAPSSRRCRTPAISSIVAGDQLARAQRAELAARRRGRCSCVDMPADFSRASGARRPPAPADRGGRHRSGRQRLCDRRASTAGAGRRCATICRAADSARDRATAVQRVAHLLYNPESTPSTTSCPACSASSSP